MIQRVKQIEDSINNEDLYYIPKTFVRSVESKLASGDIIAISTSKAGLDYAHTGLILRDEHDQARFLHASLAGKKVLLDATITSYLATVSTHTGITVARPREV
jgi:hypothetical protein